MSRRCSARQWLSLNSANGQEPKFGTTAEGRLQPGSVWTSSTAFDGVTDGANGMRSLVTLVRGLRHPGHTGLIPSRHEVARSKDTDICANLLPNCASDVHDEMRRLVEEHPSTLWRDKPTVAIEMTRTPPRFHPLENTSTRTTRAKIIRQQFAVPCVDLPPVAN